MADRLCTDPCGRGMQKFFELCGDLVEYEPRPRKEILTMVQTIVGGEAA